jgi:chemotaxis protein MotB
MAGLLFVFILLIGAIVSKSIILRSDLEQKERSLKEATKELESRKAELREKARVLEQSKERLKRLEQELQDKREALALGNTQLDKQTLIIARQNREIREAKAKIKLQADEVKKLHTLLTQLKRENSTLAERLNSSESKISSLKRDSSNLIALHKKELELSQNELKKLNQILLARNTKIDSLNSKLIVLQNLLGEQNRTIEKQKREIQDYNSRVLILSKALTNANDRLKLNDKNLTNILEALDNQKSQYEALLQKLQKQRAKIKSLTGIRLKLIDELKKTLGRKIELDRTSGALRLSSKILFDKGSSRLKDRAKSELKSAFEEYISSIMNNRAIAPYIDKIIIEGHTDSDGGYLYNLKLSQERALEVMNYLLSLPIATRYNLKKYLTASGRGYMDRVIKNGVEDKEASRRIEIKFSLKNQEAMYEIERILDETKN